ncbi:MAG: hypothetical protein ACLUEQ_12050 [Cloacibacillus evryensis]
MATAIGRSQRPSCTSAGARLSSAPSYVDACGAKRGAHLSRAF